MYKKFIITIIILIIICIGILLFFKFYSNKDTDIINEYTPEEEISEEQIRKTILSLYFQSKETKSLMPEARSIDVKILAVNPYLEIMNLLLEGPKSDKLESPIPFGTRVNNAYLEGDVVCLDLSKEFINNHPGGLEAESNTIFSIVNSLTELNEVSYVKILIDGEENLSFNDNCINFKENFSRSD